MFTIAISGPARTRAKAEVALETARIPILPDDHHAVMDWRSKFPADPDEWITVEAEHPDQVVQAIEGSKWRLRVHYHTPDPPAPSQADVLTATLADMRAEIARLKAKVG